MQQHVTHAGKMARSTPLPRTAARMGLEAPKNAPGCHSLRSRPETWDLLSCEPGESDREEHKSWVPFGCRDRRRFDVGVWRGRRRDHDHGVVAANNVTYAVPGATPLVTYLGYEVDGRQRQAGTRSTTSGSPVGFKLRIPTRRPSSDSAEGASCSTTTNPATSMDDGTTIECTIGQLRPRQVRPEVRSVLQGPGEDHDGNAATRLASSGSCSTTDLATFTGYKLLMPKHGGPTHRRTRIRRPGPAQRGGAGHIQSEGCEVCRAKGHCRIPSSRATGRSARAPTASRL